jgi:predicted HD superfamily hydrolase involved in NAD metabolism
MQGIPDKISIKFLKEWMRPRVTEKRYKHVEGVAKVAAELAQANGVSVKMAEIGAWLHDCCKEWKDTVLVEKARAFGMHVSELEANAGHLLHGPVGAQVAKAELGITNEELLAAVAEHTLGNVPMSKLSEVLFLADCLEESRPSEYTDPIWAAVELGKGKDLNAAMLKATELGIYHLLESGRPIHPRAIDVRNHYLAKLKGSTKKDASIASAKK